MRVSLQFTGLILAGMLLPISAYSVELQNWNLVHSGKISQELNQKLPTGFSCQQESNSKQCIVLLQNTKQALQSFDFSDQQKPPLSFSQKDRSYLLLTHKLPASSGLKGIFVKNYLASSAYRLWLWQDQKLRLLDQAGVIAQDPNIHQAAYGGVRANFEQSIEASLILEIQNYRAARTEFIKPMRVHLVDDYQKERDNYLVVESLTIGFLIMAALYHVLLFLLRTSDKASMFLALFCLLIALRLLITSHIWSPAFGFAEFMSYASMPLGALFFLGYLQDMLGPRYLRLPKAFLMPMFALIFSAAVLEVSYVQKFLAAFQLGMLAAILAALVAILKAMSLGKANERAIAQVLIIFSSFLLLCVLNDIFLASRLIETVDLTGFGLIGFIFGQGILISRRNSQEWEKSEATSLALNQTATAYRRFVPELFLAQLGKNEIAEIVVGDRRITEMTIFFADIRDYTGLSEKLTPEENMRFINAYLGRMIPCIESSGGLIDKFIGDAIMALFFTPAAAYEAAVKMNEKLKEYNEQRKQEGYQLITTGFGIHTGLTMLGTVGNKDRMSTTVISDAVNIAARLESLTKKYKETLIVSEEFLNRLNESGAKQPKKRALGKTKVQGKKEHVRIFALKL